VHPGRLGIIGGGAFLEAGAVTGAVLREVATPRGVVFAHVGRDFVFLRRHGEDTYRPPQRIPHHAHVLALESLGVKRVAAFASSGSLRREVRPGDLVVPDDYLSWHDPPTFAEDEYLHVVPALDECVRDLLLRAAERGLGAGREAAEPSRTGRGAAMAQQSELSVAGAGTLPEGLPAAGTPTLPEGLPAAGTPTLPEGLPAAVAPTLSEGLPAAGSPTLHRSGVYAETRGPRFETRAEVRMLAAHATVVGMTAASEATLCQERGIGYAMICTVDNWANGVGAEPLTLEHFRAQLAQSGVLARGVLGALLAIWRETREGSDRCR
jgi:purine nucleoside phosphorylase